MCRLDANVRSVFYLTGDSLNQTYSGIKLKESSKVILSSHFRGIISNFWIFVLICVLVVSEPIHESTTPLIVEEEEEQKKKKSSLSLRRIK